jgi:hypothetical protein
MSASTPFISAICIKKNGAPGETRTPDLQIRSLPLYPTELQARMAGCVLPAYYEVYFFRHDASSSHRFAPKSRLACLTPRPREENNASFYRVFANPSDNSLIMVIGRFQGSVWRLAQIDQDRWTTANDHSQGVA